MAQSLAERNGEPVEGLRQRISELEEIATDYGMKFQKAQDALKHQALLHKSQLEAADKYAKDRDAENKDLMLTIGRLRVEREASEVELDNALCELLPGTQYMDPPDGGSVTPLEQVRRMVADYRERIEELESRTVRISRPKIGRLHGALLHLWSEYDVQSAVEHAGIKFKVED
ncbi:TPA: hypothetical protein ACIXZO_003262 [Escherichia coli]|nr:hypothetical protein [Escherichia coli]